MRGVFLLLIYVGFCFTTSAQDEDRKLLLKCVTSYFENELATSPYIVAFTGTHVLKKPDGNIQFEFAGITAKRGNDTRTERKIDYDGFLVNRWISVLSGKGVFEVLEGKDDLVSLGGKKDEIEKLNSSYEVDPFQAWLGGPDAVRFGHSSPRKNTMGFMAQQPVASWVDGKEVIGVWLVNETTKTFRVVAFDKELLLPTQFRFVIVPGQWNQKGKLPENHATVARSTVSWSDKNKQGVYYPKRIELERTPRFQPESMIIEFVWGNSGMLNDNFFSADALKRSHSDDFEGFDAYFR